MTWCTGQWAAAALLVALASPLGAQAQGTGRVTEAQGTVRATVTGDSLWEIAGAVTVGGVDRNQAMAAILRRNPEAFPDHNIHSIQRGLSLAIPSLAEMRLEDPQKAAALVAQHRQAYLNKAIEPMPLYALGGQTKPAGALAASPAAPSPSVAPVVATPSPAAPSEADTSAPPKPGAMPWGPIALLAALGVAAVAVLLRRRKSTALDPDRAAEQARSSRLFADSRLDLESQLEAQPEVDSEPMYSTLDEPVDALPLGLSAPVAKPAQTLVLCNGEVSPQTASQAAAASAEASGAALALALTVAHAYADVGRPEAARRWLRAIDARGAGAFQAQQS